MNLHFFYEGSLGREEAASAFLATMLEQYPSFRKSFFDLLGLPDEKSRSLATEEWNVVTEEDEVDVTMHPQRGNHVILIENKVQASSKMAGQVSRYYQSQINKEPDKSVVFC